jgi:adenylate kinase family enzyme
MDAPLWLTLCCVGIAAWAVARFASGRRSRVAFPSVFPFARAVVVGVTSSGKSTTARALAELACLEFVELDALHWENNWTCAPRETFLERVAAATPPQERWVAAGDYRVARELLWPRAECVVWLDLPLSTVFVQLVSRSVRRWWTQELLWGKNRESIWAHLKVWSKDSLVYWLFATYWAKRRELLEQLARPEHRHLAVLRFQHRGQLQEFLAGLGAAVGQPFAVPKV